MLDATRVGSTPARALWQLLLGAGAAAILVGYSVWLVACSSGPPTTNHPPASQLAEGLNLLEASAPEWGFNAAYVKAGRVVYIESRTGQLKPEVYRTDSPNDPTHEMDLRFVDQGNRTFWAQRGGDSWVDASWDIQMAKELDPTLTLAERDQDYAVAMEGAQALTATLPASFQDHVFHLANFAATVPPTRDPQLLAKAAEYAEKAPEPTDKAFGTYSTSTWTQLMSAKYSKGAGCFAWVCGGSHTAVELYSNPNVGYWQYAISACNHGPCPGTFGTIDCFSWNGGGWFQYGVNENGASPGGGTGANDGQGGCQTAYSWDTGGYPYNHCCNDDAAYELWQTVKGTQQTGMGFENGDALGFQYQGAGYCKGDACGSGSPASYACSCGYPGSNTCSGDWNTPVCPDYATTVTASKITCTFWANGTTGPSTTVPFGAYMPVTVQSSPEGLGVYWYETLNGAPYVSNDYDYESPTPINTFPGPFNTAGASYTMYAVLRDSQGNAQCTTNAITMTVQAPQVTCAFNAATTVALGSTWAVNVTSSPEGYGVYWYGTHNGVTDSTDVYDTAGPTPINTHPGPFTVAGDTYTRYAILRDSSGNPVCTTNQVDLTVQ